MSNTNSTPTLESLQAQLIRLEKRVAKLEKERDEARENVVVKHLSRIIKDRCLFRHNGQYLPSESIRLIRHGEMTMGQAVADRNSKYPLFQVWDGSISMSVAYRMAV